MTIPYITTCYNCRDLMRVHLSKGKSLRRISRCPKMRNKDAKSDRSIMSEDAKVGFCWIAATNNFLNSLDPLVPSAFIL